VSFKGAITFPAEPAAAPQKVGPYEIVKELGRGESATIYLGRELFPAREVAIKMYDPRNMSAESRKVFQSLFLKETLLARRLKHPNITQVYDAATDDQRTYIVMEYAKEGNLDRFCAKDTLLPPERVAHLMERCCDALSYAHANGVIHRDLKPANILMGADGEAKVADFGVAFSNLTFDTTRSMTVGSPAYMAPEQLEGKHEDASTDLFAFGCVLHEMITGSRAFDGGSSAAVVAAIMTSRPKLVSELLPDAPPALEYIVDRCLAKDRDDRWQTARDLLADLKQTREALRGTRGRGAIRRQAVEARASGGARLAWSVAAVAAAIAIAIGLAWRSARPSQGSPLFLSILPPPDGFDLSPDPTASPDGRHIAFATWADVWVMRADGSGKREVVHSRVRDTDIRGVAWAPDGRRIAVSTFRYGFGIARPYRLLTVPAGGGRTTVHRHGSEMFQWIDWQPR